MQIKNYFIAFLCWVSACGVSAQSAPWTPFPHNQVSFWEQGNGKLDIYYSDSTISNGINSRVHYFGAKYYGGFGTGRCLDSVYLQTAASGTLPFDYKDTLFSDVLGRWSFIENGKSFLFDPNSRLGQSVGFGTLLGGGGYDSVQVSLIAELASDVFGRPDSLKIFELTRFLNGIQAGQALTLKLSRLAGWIEFVPFQDIVRGKSLTIWKIRGFDPVGPERFGVTNHFMDFFGDLQAGDVYKWSRRKVERTQPAHPVPGFITTLARQRDSLMSVSYSPQEDAVTVTYEHIEIGSTFDPQIVVGGIFNIDTITRVFSSNSTLFEFQKPTLAKSLSPAIQFFPSVIRTNFNPPFNSGIQNSLTDTLFGESTYHQALYHNSSCALASFFPIRNFKTLAWGIGEFSRSYEFMDVTDRANIIGYLKADGRSMGDYSPLRPLSIEGTEKSSLHLLNTIANETLWIENKSSQNFNYRLVDIMGSVLQVGTSSDEAFALSVGHLAAGMYFLQLESDGQMTVQKFSVVR